MANEIPVLWGNDIDVDVVHPLVVLKTQAAAIGPRTKGRLSADVLTSIDTKSDGGLVQVHRLILQAPAIGFHGEELLELSHDEERCYPVTVELPSGMGWEAEGGDGRMGWRVCNDQQELIRALAAALTAPWTKSLISSLLARVNERHFQPKLPVTPAGT